MPTGRAHSYAAPRVPRGPRLRGWKMPGLGLVHGLAREPHAQTVAPRQNTPDLFYAKEARYTVPISTISLPAAAPVHHGVDLQHRRGREPTIFKVGIELLDIERPETIQPPIAHSQHDVKADELLVA